LSQPSLGHCLHLCSSNFSDRPTITAETTALTMDAMPCYSTAASAALSKTATQTRRQNRFGTCHHEDRDNSPTPLFFVTRDELLYNRAHRNALSIPSTSSPCTAAGLSCFALPWPCLRGVLASIVVSSYEAKCISHTPLDSAPTHH
jgi:hypothetical protein